MPRSRRQPCNRPGCTAQIVFAVREDTGRTVPYEADDIDVNTVAAGGSHVLVEGAAWKPERPAEHFQVAFELPSLDRARDLVREYPHHRPHFHLPTSNEREQP